MYSYGNSCKDPKARQGNQETAPQHLVGHRFEFPFVTDSFAFLYQIDFSMVAKLTYNPLLRSERVGRPIILEMCVICMNL